MPVAFGAWEASAGTVLIADRASGGTPLYCGTLVFRDLLPTPAPMCARYEENQFTLNADKPMGRYTFPVMPGLVETYRLR